MTMMTTRFLLVIDNHMCTIPVPVPRLLYSLCIPYRQTQALKLINVVCVRVCVCVCVFIGLGDERPAQVSTHVSV
jgi:hypothetical protein